MESISFITFGHSVVDGKWKINRSIAANRLYIIHVGSGKYEVNGKIMPLERGWLYFFSANSDIIFINDERDPVIHTYIDFTVFPAVTVNNVIGICLDENRLLAAAAGVCVQIIKNLKKKNISREKAENILESNLKTLLYIIDEINPIETVKDERMNKVLKYIEKNYEKNIKISELSEMVYMETNHFIKVFKKNFKLSPYQYIKDYRFLIADKEIAKGEKISTAAKKIGFMSVSAFSNAYKKRFGVYPSERLKGFM